MNSRVNGTVQNNSNSLINTYKRDFSSNAETPKIKEILQLFKPGDVSRVINKFLEVYPDFEYEHDYKVGLFDVIIDQMVRRPDLVEIRSVDDYINVLDEIKEQMKQGYR